jgi:hypothetical protein
MKRLLLLLLFAAPLAFGFASLPTATDCACSAPTNIRKAGNTTSSVTYTWDAVAGAAGYKVKYLRLSDGYWPPVPTSSTSLPTAVGRCRGLSLLRTLLAVEKRLPMEQAQSFLWARGCAFFIRVRRFFL